MRKKYFILAGVVAAVAAAAFIPVFAIAPPSAVMRMNNFSLPERSVQKLKTRGIISSGKIIIDGSLTLEAPSNDPKKPFEIRAENGDIEINGEIKFVLPKKKKSALLWLREYLFSNSAALAATAPTPENISASAYAPNNRGWVITANRGNIILGPHARVTTLSGNKGITVRSGGKISGGDGEDGGDIVFNVPNGQVEVQWNSFLPGVKDFLYGPSGNAPTFVLGNGGDGGDVIVSSKDVNYGAEKLTYAAGNGGRSGKIIINASRTPPIVFYTVGAAGGQKQGPLGLRAGTISTGIVSGGRGGNGGMAEWRVNSYAPKFKKLKDIRMGGGRGGDGVLVGGNGGSAAYLSGTVISDVGSSVASVNTVGGRGGDTAFSYFPVAQARAGDGGIAVAIGNHGWGGRTGKNRNAGNGGDIFVREGDGGNILRIGSTGYLREWENISVWLSRAPYSITTIQDFVQIFSPSGRGGDGAFQSEPDRYGPLVAVAGSGGKGASGCAVRGSSGAGGNGGDGGQIVFLNGGNGGLGPIGGNGGNIYRIGASAGGLGGDGASPGKGGKSAPIGDSVSQGETADQEENVEYIPAKPGKRGELIYTFDTVKSEDGKDGKQCGEEAKKEETPSEGLPDSCTPVNQNAESYKETQTTYQKIDPTYEPLPENSKEVEIVEYHKSCSDEHERWAQQRKLDREKQLLGCRRLPDGGCDPNDPGLKSSSDATRPSCAIVTKRTIVNGAASVPAKIDSTFGPDGIGSGSCDADGNLHQPGDTITIVWENTVNGYDSKPAYKIIRTVKTYCRNCGEGGDGWSRRLFLGAKCKKDAHGKYQLDLPGRIVIFPFRGPGTNIPKDCYCRVKPKTLKKDCKIPLKDLPGDCKLPTAMLPLECRNGNAKTLPASCTIDTNDLPDTCPLYPPRLPPDCKADLNYLPSVCTKNADEDTPPGTSNPPGSPSP